MEFSQARNSVEAKQPRNASLRPKCTPVWMRSACSGVTSVWNGPVFRLALILLRLDRVGKVSQAGHADFDNVARCQRSYARRRAGQEQVAGLEGHRGCNVFKQDGQRENEVKGRAMLAKLAVDMG